MKIIDNKVLEALTAEAKASLRKRKNKDYHTGPEDLLQRLLNAIEPETYVRPHKHQNPDKREVFIILKGSAAIVAFDNAGNITGQAIISSEQGVYVVEIPAGIWHTVISLENNTVYYEVKDGPYNPENDKTFATWAPEENTQAAVNYLGLLKQKLNL